MKTTLSPQAFSLPHAASFYQVFIRKQLMAVTFLEELEGSFYTALECVLFGIFIINKYGSLQELCDRKGFFFLNTEKLNSSDLLMQCCLPSASMWSN